MATNNQLDLTPDIKVKQLTYGTKIYSSPKLSGILKDLAEKEITAKDVVFDENILLAGEYSQIGNVTKELTGTALLRSEGKTVDAVLKEILTKELSGEIATQPSVSANLYDTYEEYEAGSMFQPTIKASFIDGTYKYGPNPSTQLSGWTMTLADNAHILTSSQTYNLTTSSKNATHRFDEVIANDGMQLALTAKAIRYSSQNAANTNIGRANSTAGFATVKIPQGMTESVKTITCYRNIFIGSSAEAVIELDNNFIHTLSKVKSAATAVTVKKDPANGEVPLVANAKSIIVAVPPGRSLDEVRLVTTSALITASYEYKGQIQVTGENGMYPVSYAVYVYSPARIGQDEVHEIIFA